MIGFLSGNALKLIAAFAMVCDHAGLMLFPQVPLLRHIGRLAYPIFAFMIAEGCKYTRNKKRYLGGIAALATVCQIVYFLADGTLYFSILFTFTLSIVTIYALQNFRAKKNALSGAVFALAVASVWALNQIFVIDYGFWGCMVPVFAAAFQNTKHDRTVVHTAMMLPGLILLSAAVGGNQYLSLLALPLLLCYNGRRGRWKMKNFFYVFYPAHLVILQVLQWVLR